VRWIFFNLPNPSNCTMALGSTQPLREMSTRSFPGSKKRSAHRADNLATSMSENVGASISCNSKGLHDLYRDNFTFYLFTMFMNGSIMVVCKTRLCKRNRYYVDNRIQLYGINIKSVIHMYVYIQEIPRRKVSILGGHSISHSKQNSVYVHVFYSERFVIW
jgi:hypothetical protein